MNSDRDRQILRQAGLSHTDVAQYLGKTRQNVGYGLSKNSEWLNFERCFDIAKRLREADPEKLRRFLLALQSHGKPYVQGLNAISEAASESRLELGGNPFKQFKREAWVFSNEPAELERGDFLQTMLDEHFVYPERRFVYFLAPGQNADQLSSILKHSIGRLKKNDHQTAHISVITTNAMLLVPHTVIFDATVMDDHIEPRGYALGKSILLDGEVSENDQFFEIPHGAVVRMINAVRTAGIGISDDSFFPDDIEIGTPIHGTKDTFYQIVFSTELKG